MTLAQLCLALFSVAAPAAAHIALWDSAMYGLTDDPNQSNAVAPLMDLAFDDWWFHGYIDIPPANDTFMDLPSGGTYHGEVACNKALTSLGDNASQQTGIWACEGTGDTGGIGAMHTADAWESSDPQDVKGCGIGIAYESDVSKIQPEDFTIISVNYTCPWKKHVEFQIPSDLPPCPEGGCHCMWGWIHSADSGSEQNYFVGYRCNVTGATGVTALPQANTANKCDYPTDTSNCTVGAKQPHYWFQKERNNNMQGTYDPPFYNGAYGFMDGAQTDLFAALNSSSNTTTSSSSEVTANATSDANAVSNSSILSSASALVSTTSASVVVAVENATASSTSASASTSLYTSSSSSSTASGSVSASGSTSAPASAVSSTSASSITSSAAATAAVTESVQTLQTTVTTVVTAHRSSSASSSASSSVEAETSTAADSTASASVNSGVSLLSSATNSTTVSTCMRKRSGVRKHNVRRKGDRVLKRAVGGAPHSE